jgi:SAM-dependent methyltransferase
MLSSPVSRHNDEIHANRLAWARKAALREAYGDFYRRIAAAIDRSIPGEIVELGSGMGNLRTFVPDVVLTDLFPNPWLDRTENVYALSSPDGSVGHLILFDVWHHLEYPADALAEFHRVLRPGGRVLVLEPAMSLVGRCVYGLCHPEPLGLRHTFPEAPSALAPAAKARYFAAQASCHRLLRNREIPALLGDWRFQRVEELVSFRYLAAGGFRSPQLYPDCCLPLLRALDRAASLAPTLFAARLFVVLEKP